MRARRGENLPTIGSEAASDDPQEKTHRRGKSTPVICVTLILVLGLLVLLASSSDTHQGPSSSVMVPPPPRRAQEHTEPRIDVGVVVRLGNEADATYAREWFEYHVLLGVRRFDVVVTDPALEAMLKPYAGIARAYDSRRLAELGADESDEAALLERLYEVAKPKASWLVFLRPNEYLVSPTRAAKVATDIDSFVARFATNPLFEAVDPALRRPAGAEENSFARKLVAAAAKQRGTPQQKGRIVQWAPSIADALDAMDDTNAVTEWAGVALPWTIFGDAGRRSAATGLSTVASYTRRADPAKARDWRTRSYTAVLNTEGCGSMRADARSAVHVCRRANRGWAPYLRAATGYKVPATTPTLSEEVQRLLRRSSGRPKFPYVARYTRSASEYSNATGASPARELSRHQDGDVVRQLEARLRALDLALNAVGANDFAPHFRELVGILLGPAHLERRRELGRARLAKLDEGDPILAAATNLDQVPAWLVRRS